MPTSDRKIPNNPLNGAELKEFVIEESSRLLADTEERLMFALRERMNNDALFSKQYGHPRVKVSLSLKFQWSNMHLPETLFRVAVGDHAILMGEDAVHFIHGVDREVSIDNPNLTRIDAGLPIVVTEVDRPAPGEIIGSIRQVDVPMEGGAYPKPSPPVDTDTTEEVAKELGIPETKRLRPPKRSR